MDYSEIVSKIKPSIALIIAANKDDSYGTGSGFVFAKKGILVTCNHVVKDANTILIKFFNGEHIPAKIVVRDEEHDLALLKFDDDSRLPVSLANIEDVKEGMPIIFSGYPLSIQDLTTHQGIISAIIKDATGIATFLIDGTVNSGNSGCPLMNSKGEVIGVVNAKRREQSDLLSKVEDMKLGTMSLHGVDLVQIYQALINNVQLGIGYAVPASYIPEHKDMEEIGKKFKEIEKDNKLEERK